MNTRIDDLMYQAGLTAQGCWDELGTYEQEAIEKFAELIVKECVEVCRRGKYGGREDMSLIQFNNGIRFCINAIDEHFGVKP